jgi:hypothetical protein
MSHDDVNQAAFHALKTAHDGVRRHLCRNTNPCSCRKTNPTGAKMKTCSKESICRSFGRCMVYIRSSNEGEQETNDEARNESVESVVSKFCTSLKFRPPSRFFLKRLRQMIFQELEGSRALHNLRRKITPCDHCDDCLPIIIRRRHSNLLSWFDYFFLAGERPRTLSRE